uniref:Uncharacterized protein n=1 Tax=Neobodo designis TaxID=312471 RepID=A0A7S1QAB4_NEODS
MTPESATLLPHTAKREHGRRLLPSALIVCSNSPFDIAIEFSAVFESVPSAASLQAALELTAARRASLAAVARSGWVELAKGPIDATDEVTASGRWAVRRCVSEVPARAVPLTSSGDATVSRALRVAWECLRSDRVAAEPDVGGVGEEEEGTADFGVDLSEEINIAAGIVGNSSASAGVAGDTALHRHRMTWEVSDVSLGGECVRTGGLSGVGRALSLRLQSIPTRRRSAPTFADGAGLQTSHHLNEKVVNDVLRAVGSASRGCDTPPQLLATPPAPDAMTPVAPSAVITAAASLRLQNMSAGGALACEVAHLLTPAVVGSEFKRLPMATILSEGLSFCSAHTRLEAKAKLASWCKAAARLPCKPSDWGAPAAWKQYLSDIDAPLDLQEAVLDDLDRPRSLRYLHRRDVAPAPLPQHAGFMSVTLPVSLSGSTCKAGDHVLVAPLSAAAMRAAERLVADAPDAMIWTSSTSVVVSGTVLPEARCTCEVAPKLTPRAVEAAQRASRGLRGAEVSTPAALREGSGGTNYVFNSSGVLGQPEPTGSPVLFGSQLLGFVQAGKRGSAASSQLSAVLAGARFRKAVPRRL